jgi:hypothetical protein
MVEAKSGETNRTASEQNVLTTGMGAFYIEWRSAVGLTSEAVADISPDG